MENLKSVLADKIIEISSGSGDNVKEKLDRVNRFKDFAEACRSLMEKYPAIEDELIRMVRNNDFDTKLASTRVDSLIRLADREEKERKEKEEQEKREEEKRQEEEKLRQEQEQAQQSADIPFVADIEEPLDVTENPIPEDADYEEIPVENNEQDLYADYEEIEEVVDRTPKEPEKETQGIIIEEYITPEKANGRNEKVRRAFQAIIAIAAILLLIFIIVFIIKNWKLILYTLGGLAIVALIAWILLKKKKK